MKRAGSGQTFRQFGALTADWKLGVVEGIRRASQHLVRWLESRGR